MRSDNPNISIKYKIKNHLQNHIHLLKTVQHLVADKVQIVGAREQNYWCQCHIHPFQQFAQLRILNAHLGPR